MYKLLFSAMILILATSCRPPETAAMVTGALEEVSGVGEEEIAKLCQGHPADECLSAAARKYGWYTEPGDPASDWCGGEIYVECCGTACCGTAAGCLRFCKGWCGGKPHELDDPDEELTW